MDTVEGLRERLTAYVRKKFYTRRNIKDIADEIVNQTFLNVAKSPCFNSEQYNFGYMSLACVRTAYKVFHKNDHESNISVSFDLTAPLIDEDDFVEEISKSDDTKAILQSLQTLKLIEQVVINERYYGDFSFREISERHGIKLNTLLTHHRRALEKLRPILSLYFERGEENKGGNPHGQ